MTPESYANQPKRKRVGSMTRRKDFSAVRERFSNDDGLPFGRLLSQEYVLSVLADEGHVYRPRVFCPLVTLWGWLSQSLSQDKSLSEAVSRIVAHRVRRWLASMLCTDWRLQQSTRAISRTDDGSHGARNRTHGA